VRQLASPGCVAFLPVVLHHPPCPCVLGSALKQNTRRCQSWCGQLEPARRVVGPAATSDFIICIGDQPELDFGAKRNPDGQGFVAFGRMVKGMAVVRKIQAAPAEGQALTPPVQNLRVTRSP